MGKNQGCVRMFQDEQALTFLVEGWGTMRHSLWLRRLAEEALGQGSAVRIDLRHCTYLDSTFLGTLLRLLRVAERQSPGRFALVNPSVDCCQVLHQMALDRILPMLSAAEPGGNCTELPSDQDEVKAFQGNVVEAHQELAKLPGETGATFRAVVECLEKAPAPRPNGSSGP